MQPAIETAVPHPTVDPLRASLAALTANFVGIGLARFGYTALIPALVAEHWFSPSAAVYLGAANLAGYLAGALLARFVAARLGTVPTLRGAMLLTAASLFACASPLGFAWFFLWRLLSGCTGGALMALAAPAVLATIPPEKRGMAGGVIFLGVGLGIAVSGTLVPLLMHRGLMTTWLGLAASALALSLLTWTAWPPADTALAAAISPGRSTTSVPLRALYGEYALTAVGLVPHMVFLVDFVARGLHRGLETGGLYWMIFGTGALVGPLVAGYSGDRIGWRSTLRLALALEAAAVLVPLFSVSGSVLSLSSFMVGAYVPGSVTTTIGRMRELAGDNAADQAKAWSYCTTAFALGQALAGYGYSFIFAHMADGYSVLFALGAGAFMLALAVDLVARAAGPVTSDARAV